ncbi:response regulator [Paenibacillus sp. Marseille-Q4541]|uniref:response regulator transcription factor n=1 Tax=Paenibacillus sp. Marseille-Q4541 TaxID=2831522 RepID=UPI001BAABABE|nr:response regulator [Paenibacillus sp. Marseille-Q4541]
MCKLLIVEDELLIRTGLKHYFPWQELNVTDIYEAENGADGLKLALEVRPDLIISDIRMPEMNGLEMIEQLRPLLPDTFYLILTGYHDFDYAKQAIQLGNIQDYLLKPLEYEESMKSVQSVLELIKTKKEERERQIFLEEEQIKWKQSLVMKQLLDSIGEKEFPSEIIALSDQLNRADVTYLPMVITNIAPYGGIPMPVRKWTDEAFHLIEEHMKTLPIMLEGYSVPILSYLIHNKLYAIVACKLENTSEHTLPEQLQKMNHKQTHKMYFAFGHSSPSFLEMGEQLKFAEELLLLRYHLPASYYFTPNINHSSLLPETSYFKLDGMEKSHLLTALEQKDTKTVRQLILSFSHHGSLQGRTESTHQWLAFIQELVSVILRYAGQNHIPAAQIYSEAIIKLNFVEDFQNTEQLFTWLADWAEQTISYSAQGEGQLADTNDTYVFSEIENFIKQHLDHDLSLQMVAERFFYNPSYLSRLFKTKLNKNYMTYVTELRIRYAQEYLRDPNLLISDVSNMCGYKSYKHFVKTFRNVTHMTPTHYRKRIGM